MRERLLVTGSDGYIGSILCRKLLSRFDLVGYDTGYYRDSYLYSPLWDLPRTMTKDIRHISASDIQGVKGVVCLSDLNDPLSQAYPEVTRQINYEGLVRFAALCKDAGVEKFLYSSSASVYGAAADEVMDEGSELLPQTPYAEYKALMEEHLLSLCDDHFSAACLRNATVYGLSPRMRFDLVINYLCGAAVARQVIELSSDGNAWRPFVHIEDVCDAFIAILDLPASTMSGLIINVGDAENGNYRVIDIARMIQEITGCAIATDDKNADRRSYRIDSGKLNRLGIHCRRDVQTEIREMLTFFRQIGLTSDVLYNRTHTRLAQIQYLLRTKQIDHRFLWTST